MRSATLSRDVLASNLSSLLESMGKDAVLDVRGDAYGCGTDIVSSLGREVGFTRAHYGGEEPTGPLEPSSKLTHLATGWWSGSGGELVEFTAHVLALKRVPAGSSVSYGYHYTTSEETTLALISAGYADGVPRTASGVAQVSLGGSLVPIAGRIAMDQCVLDIGQTTAAVGDRATLWGDTPTLAQWSQWSKRPEGALLSHLGSRVVKQWI